MGKGNSRGKAAVRDGKVKEEWREVAGGRVGRSLEQGDGSEMPVSDENKNQIIAPEMSFLGAGGKGVPRRGAELLCGTAGTSPATLPDYLEHIQAVWNTTRPTGTPPGHVVHFQATWNTTYNTSRPSGTLPDRLEQLQATWNTSRPPETLPGHLEHFQATWNTSRPLGTLSGHLEHF